MDDSVAALNLRLRRVSPSTLAARLERTGGPRSLNIVSCSWRASFLRLERPMPLFEEAGSYTGATFVSTHGLDISHSRFRMQPGLKFLGPPLAGKRSPLIHCGLWLQASLKLHRRDYRNQIQSIYRPGCTSGQLVGRSNAIVAILVLRDQESLSTGPSMIRRHSSPAILTHGLQLMYFGRSKWNSMGLALSR